MSDATIGSRLAEDKWLVFNTLPFIFEHLPTPDLLRCSLVCKLWYELTQDSICWKTVQFSNNCHVKIDFCGLLNILKERKTVHLKIEKAYCVDMVPLYPTSETNLKILEIGECSSMLCETFLHVSEKFESVKLEMICGALFTPFKISLIAKMSNLRELRLSLSTESDIFKEFPFELRNLRVLYILNIEHMFKNTKFCDFKSNKLEVLALGNVGDMPESDILSILQASPDLKKLRLESCSNWNTEIFFRAVGQMKNLTCLELLNFKILAGFEHSVQFCPNIEKLTIMPGLDRFYMSSFNARIYKAAQNIGKTEEQAIKKFTLGFSKKYLKWMNDMMDERSVMSFLRFGEDYIEKDPLFKFGGLLPMDELEAELSSLMPGAKVQVIELDYLGNIFR